MSTAATLDAPAGGRDAAARTARVACFMMQKNEELLLGPWLRYHAHLFGARSLFVLDNGSTAPSVLAMLEQAEAMGVTVHRQYAEKQHFENKGTVFRDLIRALDPAAFDFVMPLDCDEFVAHQALDGRVSCEPEAVTGYLAARHLRDPRVLLIRGSYFNVPDRPGDYFFTAERKCFFAQGMLRAFGMGFHHGTSLHSDMEVRTELVHFHYRYKPFASFDAHAREKLAARLADFDAEKVRAYRGKGSHLARFMALGPEGYAAYFDRYAQAPLASLRDVLARLGTPIPF